MSTFTSQIDVKSEAYQRNRTDMLALIDRLDELNSRAGKLSESRKDRFTKRGQITPRSRLGLLLDPGMPFLSIGNLSGYLLNTDDEQNSIPGSTAICGIGFIMGIRCMVFVNDSAIQAGAMNTASGYKIQRAQTIALEQKLPFVHLVESAGGDLLNYRVDKFTDGGRMFANFARLSKAGIPVITVLHGSATAGGAYMPGMSDYVVAVKGRGKAFLAGPPLLKAATGEIATDEELGGAEMHATVSGLAEYFAEDDGDAILIARSVVERLDWNSRVAQRFAENHRDPIYDPDEIAGVVPVDYRKPYEVREVIARIVDGSEFVDFKPGFGVSTVCIHADVFGHRCGFISNNGPIDPNGAAKATQFLQLCDQAGTPVVFLHNTTGYIVGTDSERRGMIKHGSKMIQAVTNIEVPRYTFIIGASFGAGNYGMCGRGYDPDFLFNWPNSSIGIMGGEQAAKVMSIVAEGVAQAKGTEPDREALAKQEEFLIAHYNKQADAFYTSGNLMDDGMIDPRQTRYTLGFLLATSWEARNRECRTNSFGIARI